MKILLILYIFGVVCGTIGNLIIRLEISSYIRDKKKQGIISNSGWQISLAASIKTIVQILTPIYHYFILIGAMNTPREKLIKAMDDAMKQNSSGLFMAFVGDDEKGYRYMAGSLTQNVEEVGKMLREKLGANGGGRGTMVQGMVSAKKAETLEVV